ncbi:PucR family transcriptional regulator ligand-binding domain-containing protein [Propionibacterium freudenreichii]|nr:PucR family transcriptional regulator ligand-binding domain-containing protein [Propionibacterium freudenreichii]
MAITVRDLLAAPELRLVLREPGGEGALDRAVRWIHQSELPDSTGFTEPGEVLITTGAVLPQGAEADSDHGRRLYADYVQRLRDTSVVALGFGLGPQHETVPGSLLTAAHQAGLPLFEIPWAIPFSAVVKAVSQAQASAEQANLLRTNRAQRRLIGAVGRADAAHALVSTTAQIIDGWSALTDTSGHVITRAGAVPLERLAELATVHQGAGRASSFATGAMVQNIDGVQGRRIGLLMAGRRRDLDSIEQSACLLAAQLLGGAIGVVTATSRRHGRGAQPAARRGAGRTHPGRAAFRRRRMAPGAGRPGAAGLRGGRPTGAGRDPAGRPAGGVGHRRGAVVDRTGAGAAPTPGGAPAASGPVVLDLSAVRMGGPGRGEARHAGRLVG